MDFKRSSLLLGGVRCNPLTFLRQSRKQYDFPVPDYDGQRIPFSDESFDLVFSSNVLEHVNDVGSLLTESRRVLCREGMAIHILPSPYWRIWTSLAHYVYVALRVMGGSPPVSGGVVPSVTEKIEHRGIWYVITTRSGRRGRMANTPVLYQRCTTSANTGGRSVP